MDFPLPVGPVTRISPLGKRQRSRITEGSLISSGVRIFEGMCLKTAQRPFLALRNGHLEVLPGYGRDPRQVPTRNADCP